VTLRRLANDFYDDQMLVLDAANFPFESVTENPDSQCNDRKLGNAGEGKSNEKAQVY
jgi:hypothetical protein